MPINGTYFILSQNHIQLKPFQLQKDLRVNTIDQFLLSGTPVWMANDPTYVSHTVSMTMTTSPLSSDVGVVVAVGVHSVSPSSVVT